jgi:ribosomal protein S20
LNRLSIASSIYKDKETIVPIIKSAIKRAKQTIKRNERNVGIKRDIKEAVKAFHANPSATTLAKAQSEFDTAVKKNVLKKNTASRRKAGLSKAAKIAGVKLGVTKKATVAKAAPKAAAKPATAAAKKPAAKATPAAKKAPTKKPAAKK